MHLRDSAAASQHGRLSFKLGQYTAISMTGQPGSRASGVDIFSGYTGNVHAIYVAISLECHERPPDHALAKSLFTVENRNLLWCEDAKNWLSGILGIQLAGTKKHLAFSEVDG